MGIQGTCCMSVPYQGRSIFFSFGLVTDELSPRVIDQAEPLMYSLNEPHRKAGRKIRSEHHYKTMPQSESACHICFFCITTLEKSSKCYTKVRRNNEGLKPQAWHCYSAESITSNPFTAAEILRVLFLKQVSSFLTLLQFRFPWFGFIFKLCFIHKCNNSYLN